MGLSEIVQTEPYGVECDSCEYQQKLERRFGIIDLQNGPVSEAVTVLYWSTAMSRAGPPLCRLKQQR